MLNTYPGPIAQLGERFNGIEEVKSSNLFRSTQSSPQTHKQLIEGQFTVSKEQRSIWDDLKEIGRDLADRLEEVFNPDQKRRQPVRVPVPVRNNPPQDYEYPQR